MKGKKTFEQKNRCTFSFGDNNNPPPQRPVIKSYLHKNTKPKEKTIQPPQDTFRLFQKRLNRSVDLAETNFKNKIIRKLIPTNEQNEAKARKKAENTSVLFTEKFYQKFINKPKAKANPKTSTDSIQFEITKSLKDNKVIDIQTIKHSLNSNGINVYKIQNNSGLTPVANDRIIFSVRAEDSQTTKFQRIKEGLKNKGLQIKEKERIDSVEKVRPTTPIYSVKSKWTDLNFAKKGDSINTQNNERKAIITKNYNPDLVYKNNNPPTRKKGSVESKTRCDTSISNNRKSS